MTDRCRSKCKTDSCTNQQAPAADCLPWGLLLCGGVGRCCAAKIKFLSCDCLNFMCLIVSIFLWYTQGHQGKFALPFKHRPAVTCDSLLVISPAVVNPNRQASTSLQIKTNICYLLLLLRDPDCVITVTQIVKPVTYLAQKTRNISAAPYINSCEQPGERHYCLAGELWEEWYVPSTARVLFCEYLNVRWVLQGVPCCFRRRST